MLFSSRDSPERWPKLQRAGQHKNVIRFLIFLQANRKSTRLQHENKRIEPEDSKENHSEDSERNEIAGKPCELSLLYQSHQKSEGEIAGHERRDAACEHRDKADA